MFQMDEKFFAQLQKDCCWFTLPMFDKLPSIDPNVDIRDKSIWKDDVLIQRHIFAMIFGAYGYTRRLATAGVLIVKKLEELEKSEPQDKSMDNPAFAKWIGLFSQYYILWGTAFAYQNNYIVAAQCLMNGLKTRAINLSMPYCDFIKYILAKVSEMPAEIANYEGCGFSVDEPMGSTELNGGSLNTFAAEMIISALEGDNGEIILSHYGEQTYGSIKRLGSANSKSFGNCIDVYEVLAIDRKSKLKKIRFYFNGYFSSQSGNIIKLPKGFRLDPLSKAAEFFKVVDNSSFTQSTASSGKAKNINEKNHHLIDLTHITPSIREGIMELIQYDCDIHSKEFVFSEVVPEKTLLKIIKGVTHTTPAERWSALSEIFQNLSGYIFSELGYDFESAYELLDKLYQVDESTDDEEIIALLREFDKISCCIAKFDVYPGVLIESLSLIERWMLAKIAPNCENDIMYVLSLYKHLCMASTYEDAISEKNYRGYKSNGFMYPQKRKIISTNGDMDTESDDIFNLLCDIDDMIGPNSLNKIKSIFSPNNGLENPSDDFDEIFDCEDYCNDIYTTKSSHNESEDLHSENNLRCPNCNEDLSFMGYEEELDVICPFCNTRTRYKSC